MSVKYFYINLLADDILTMSLLTSAKEKNMCDVITGQISVSPQFRGGSGLKCSDATPQLQADNKYLLCIKLKMCQSHTIQTNTLNY